MLHYYFSPVMEQIIMVQMLASVGLVESVDTDHMYFAAMESKSCRLTVLGAHYWKLSKDKRF